MIEIKEWRLITEDFRLAGAPMIIQVAQMNEILDRLEAAEKERDALRNEIACVKEVEFPRKAQAVADAWEGKCKRLEAERDALRAKIEAMERQEPVAWMHETRRDSDVVTDAVKHVWGKVAVGSMAAYSIPLYTLPGAQTQPAPSIPDDVMRDAKRYRFLRAAKNIPISTEAARDPIVYDAAIDAAMLDAAPEAKP